KASLHELETKLQEASKALEILKNQGVFQAAGEGSIFDKYAELERQNTELQKKIQLSSESYFKLEKELQQKRQELNEMKQKEFILSDVSQSMEEKAEAAEKAKAELTQQVDKEHEEIHQAEQEKILLQESVALEEKEKAKATKKYYYAVMVAGLGIAVVFGVYSYLFMELAGEQYRMVSEPIPSGYLIQNLKGDVIDTFLSWRLVQDDILYVNIVNTAGIDPEIIDAVEDAVMSEESVEIDDSLLHKGPQGQTSLMYLGWLGALKAASETETELYIPTNIEIIHSSLGQGDITIELTKGANADGYSGWANSIADQAANQILKSRVTIFSIDSLDPDQIKAITRHESGHAFGLAHSSDPEDLMAPTIGTEFPYISECDVAAIIHLYNGGKDSYVTCEK
ncbi:MAG: matrixin family metalloprotease, partial [Nitrosopumilaceae archaeon]